MVEEVREGEDLGDNVLMKGLPFSGTSTLYL